ncbi:MAG: NAD-binding protein, partial [Planctomycetota bacterium]
IGGGIIGLEMAENLVHRGLAVSLVEKSSQVMPALDAEMATVAGIQAAASTLRAKAPEPLVGSDAPIYARITEDGATVHIGLTEEYRRG